MLPTDLQFYRHAHPSPSASIILESLPSTCNTNKHKTRAIKSQSAANKTVPMSNMMQKYKGTGIWPSTQLFLVQTYNLSILSRISQCTRSLLQDTEYGALGFTLVDPHSFSVFSRGVPRSHPQTFPLLRDLMFANTNL